MNPYIGHAAQLYGVEEMRLIGGKGDGCRLYTVRNGQGLEATINIDRCMDIPRLTFKGVNCSYISPCGYVAPTYYDTAADGLGFLKSFTAGFLTTCGLTQAGSPCMEDGKMVPLHGDIANIPAENASAVVEDDQIVLRGRMNSAEIFKDKLALERKIIFSLKENAFEIEDTIRNEGDTEAPLMLLYHMNMGYPLLSEKARLTIPAAKIVPRDEHAAQDLDTCHKLLPPTPHFQEQCYLHSFEGEHAFARLENPECGIGVEISFDPRNLPCLTEWKMMGVRDYVLGLEPGLNFPTGRAEARKEGTLGWLQPGAERKTRVDVKLFTL